MILTKPDGSAWRLDRVNEKLILRGTLPGARIFDLATDSLRKCGALPAVDRLALALPASWCVNSPADSRLFRRWVLPPQREVWLALVELLEQPRTGPLDAESREAIDVAFRAIAPEPTGVETVSKVLALLLPDVVPLMPPLALAFLLGSSAASPSAAFVAVLDWFAMAVEQAKADLAAWARAHSEVPLSGAQVLDRVLWFDSDGHRHFRTSGAPPAG
jgi:hypothetical protein